MIKSARQNHASLINSANQSKISSSQNSKKYRCECCKEKPYHDYNRQKRLRRESVSSKRVFTRCQSSSQQSTKENILTPQNVNLISNIDNYQVRQKQKSSLKKLPAIIQSPHLIKQHLPKDNSSSKKTPKVDMRSYCKALFSSNKKMHHKNLIEVKLNDEIYFIAFDSSEKMKLAIGEVKLLIQKMEK